MFSVDRHSDRRLTWWHEKKGSIDFDPVYQRRGGLWSKRDKAYLVDSILNGYDIPKFYVADFTKASSPLNVKKMEYAIIDGKQRFESIFDFFEGHLALAPDFVYQKNPSLHLGGIHYADLQAQHPNVCRIFDECRIEVMSVVTDEKGKIEELFIRLNRALVRLSGAEIRNAKPGIVPQVIRNLAEHKFFTSRARFQVDRYQDRDLAAKLLLFEHKGKLVSTKKTDLDDMVDQVKVTSGPATQPYREAARHVVRHLDAMASVFVTKDALLGKQGVVPVYYLLVRNQTAGQRANIRKFLLKFEEGRKLNDRRAKNNDRNTNEEFLVYSKARRSHNDAGSMSTMYDMLVKHFTRFVRAKA